MGQKDQKPQQPSKPLTSSDVGWLTRHWQESPVKHLKALKDSARQFRGVKRSSLSEGKKHLLDTFRSAARDISRDVSENPQYSQDFKAQWHTGLILAHTGLNKDARPHLEAAFNLASARRDKSNVSDKYRMLYGKQALIELKSGSANADPVPAAS